ncbi:MAG: cryptochrome/photolyase family protein [Rhodothermales bacterium]|nr:cryptochrome/photolyase family protein [Rhodothermales bacterium]
MPDARHLILVLGDQLSADAAAFDGADATRDVVAMAEVEAEVHRHPNHRQRVALFFAAMRHFRDALRDRGFTVKYQRVGAKDAAESLPEYLRRMIDHYRPERVVLTEPGRHDLREALRETAAEAGADLDLREDDHFLASHADFDAWAEGRSTLTMEYFYRAMRRRYGVLMRGDDPEGDRWNLDQENREAFREAPGAIKEPIHFRPDAVTQGALDDVEDRFPDLYGTLDGFDWPVTPGEARRAVRDFVEHRLPHFGTYQDAMWAGRPYLYHSRISAALNLKLIDPRYVIEKVEEAYREGHVPLNAAEGFIRQILGWREFIRGVYWREMPGYHERNALDARRALPDLFWTGATEMACLRDVVTQLLETAYAHHIQRLMVTGLFALLYGVRPQAVHDWYMALFIDSVEWVTLPNVLGMSQYGDGGIVGTKPYTASGRYIQRQSNYCAGCRYDPTEATGADACPFTTLYWDFLIRHEERLDGNRRMNFQLANLRKKSGDEREAIAAHARTLRRKIREGTA